MGTCLRNRSAVAAWVQSRLLERGASKETVVAAGERWSDGSLRPSVEDLWGAGAVIALLGELGVGELSPEARGAAAAFRDDALRECSGGVELSDAGFGDDVRVAARLDASRCVPVLDAARFVDAVG
ncbi:MAG TPA: 2-phosphosulfolactate phosphatase [Nocardioidaceae bacterium]|nr:2-phosphosulfolactate phosphatase [Nocardioidaceae bacterium]